MRFVFASVLAAALAVGVAAPVLAPAIAQVTSRAYTVEPFAPSTPVTIQGTGVRLRAEPFATSDTPVLSNGSTGLVLTVVGIARQADWNWYQVVLKNGQKAFIRSDLTSAPSRGGASPAPTQVATPVQPQPPVVYIPPPQPQAYIPANPTPTYQPAPAQPLPAQPAQPLPSIPTTPLTNSGAISLTPGGPAPQLPPASTTPAPATSPPVDNGLLSISPTAPAPRFADPAPAPLAPASAPVATPVRPASVASLGVAESIRAQLNVNRCWTDSSTMMDAHRLRATFGISFGPNGKFAADPRLITPAAEPANDPAMMVFLAKARAALRTCNAMGFTVPEDYYSSGGGEIRLDFSAR